MKKNVKRFAAALAVMLVLTLLAACAPQSAQTAQTTLPAQSTAPVQSASATQAPQTAEPAASAETGLLADKETTLTILMPEHVSYPVKTYEESPFLQYITQITNVKLDLMVVPDADNAYKQKLSIMLNSADIPDIIWSSSDDANINSLAVKGMFAAYTDHLDTVEHIAALLESTPDIVKNTAASDGKLYIMPRLTLNTMTELFIIREDIMQAEGLSDPADYDELYTLLKTLQEKYPDKKVFVNRNGAEHLVNRLGYSWGTGYETATCGFYLDRESDAYVYGPSEENFKQMVLWLKKLYDEGLLDSEYALMSTQQWEEAFANEEALFTIDYIARVQTLNTNYINAGSTARVVGMNPPAGPTGQFGILGRSKVMGNSGVVINAKASDLTLALKFVDWVFSDEGRYTATYGIEGETFTIDDEGHAVLTEQMSRQANPEGKELIKDYGWVYYLNKYEFPEGFTRNPASDPEPVDDRYMYSREVMESIGAVIEPDPTLSYTDAQSKTLKTAGTDVSDCFKQNIDKFIMGTRPIDEWEQFVAEVEKLGVAEVGEALNEAYAAYKAR